MATLTAKPTVKLSLSTVVSTWISGSPIGYCRVCGEDVYDTPHDARAERCPDCGEYAVDGVETLLMVGLL